MHVYFHGLFHTIVKIAKVLVIFCCQEQAIKEYGLFFTLPLTEMLS